MQKETDEDINTECFEVIKELERAHKAIGIFDNPYHPLITGKVINTCFEYQQQIQVMINFLMHLAPMGKIAMDEKLYEYHQIEHRANKVTDYFRP